MKRIALTFMVIVLVLTGTGYLVARLMEDDVTELVVQELNKNLLTPIQAANIRLSFLRKFPKASIEFRDVVALSPKNFNRTDFGNEGDTLFRMHRIFLEFNLWNILQKNPKVQSIHAQQGKVWILTSHDKSSNYIFWKSSEKEDTAQFSLELQHLRFSDVECIYSYKPTALLLHASIEKATLQGTFSVEQFSLLVDGKAKVFSLMNENTAWIKDQAFELGFTLGMDGADYTFRNTRIKSGNLVLAGEGNLSLGKKENLDLKFHCEGIDIPYLAAYLPDEYKGYVRDYSIKGGIKFAVAVQGKPEDPAIRIDFTTTAAGLQYPGKPRMEKLKTSGYFQDSPGLADSNAILEFSTFSTAIDGGSLNARIRIKRPSKPLIKFTADFKLPLASLQQLAVSDSIYGLNGWAEGSLAGEGGLMSFAAFSAKELASWQFNGSAKIIDATIEDRSNMLKFEHAGGKLWLGENLRMEDFSFISGANTYRLNVEIADIADWLFLSGQVLKIRGNIYSPSLEYSIEASKDPVKKESGRVPVLFPDSIYLDLNVAAGSLKIGRLEAGKLSCKLSYQPYMFTVHSMDIETMGGRLSGGLVLLQRFNKDILLRTQSKLDKLDISKLFYSFRNFGQNELTDNHLRGLLSGTVNMQAEWNKYLEVKEESILAESSFEITNGELIQFEPMKGLSSYIEVSELEHIYFSQLKNEIYIRNRSISIPNMDINSSALNIRASGVHNFDNEFTYNVQLSLSEVLAGKAKKARKENQEFGIVEPDENHPMSLFLVISGKWDDYKVNYDAKSAVKSLRGKIGKERTTLRTIFREEFGKRGQDSIPSLDKSAAKKPLFRMEFEDEESVEGDLPEKKDKKLPAKKEPAFKIEWDENDPDSLSN